MSEKAKKIGARIKIIRVTKGLQQMYVAKRIGVSQALLSNIESGRSTVTLETLFKLQEVFGCPMKSFFADIDAEERSAENSFTLDDLVAALMFMKKR